MTGSVLQNAVKRVEDPRFLRGEGRYLDDLGHDAVLHMLPVRSPVPHGLIEGLETEEALAVPGVVGVYTAADFDLEPQAPGPLCPEGTGRPPIASDRVRFSGEIVAVVVAETPAAARDAADLVWVDVEPLDAVADVDAALAEGAPLLFDELGTNVVIDRSVDPDPGLFDDADVIVRGSFQHQKLAAVPVEANGALAVPADDGTMTVWVGSQNVFEHRRIGDWLGMEEGSLVAKVPDMGGGFGAKASVYPEQMLTVAVARMLDRPVRWAEGRQENLVAMTHGRGQGQEVELGLTNDGRVTALRVRLTQDAGAYPVLGAFLPFMTQIMASGTYLIPKVEVSWRSVVTNTTPTHAYRGAGRPEAATFVERIFDLAADELGLDPVEIRRRNLIPADAFPYQSPTGAVYDSGDYGASLDRALDIADYASLRAEQARRIEESDRSLLGIGVASYVEITAPGQGQSEWSRVEVHPDGTATAWVGTSGHGQGHETAFAQVVAAELGIDHTDVTLIQGDTSVIASGGGTVGSRSLQLGGSAVKKSTEEVVEKGKRIFAHLKEAAVWDVVVRGGGVEVAGVPDTHMGWGDLAAVASDPARLPPPEGDEEPLEPGLAFAGEFVQDASTFPFGAHVCVVEVDSDTGTVEVRQHVAVDDCGTILNRLLVDGQVHGGVSQGIGQAVFEQVLHDEAGYPMTGSLATYSIPTAGSLPFIDIAHTETPTPNNPLGAKGIGESGTIGATAAAWNAVNDALRSVGVRHLDMPTTPLRVWEAIQAAHAE